MRTLLIALTLLFAVPALPAAAEASPAALATVAASADARHMARRIARVVKNPSRGTYRRGKRTYTRRKGTRKRWWPRGRWGYLNGVYGYWPYYHGRYYPYAWGYPHWDYRYGWGPYGPPPGNWDMARVNTPAPPNFMGDLYVWSSVAPLYAYPSNRSQVLARLPRRTVVTNMGRYYSYFKVEAPNGQTGFIYAGAVGPQPF